MTQSFLQGRSKIQSILLCSLILLGSSLIINVASHNGGSALIFPTPGNAHLQTSFRSDALPGPIGKIAFTASATGGTGPYSYSWKLGDSSTAEGQVITHSYTSVGAYIANLTVTDAAGNDATSSRTVPVGNSLALHVKGSNIVDSNNNSVALVGLNYGDYPNDVYPNQFNTGNLTRDAVDIRNAGFNVVNLIEEWANLEKSSTPSAFTYDTPAWNLMQARITALTHQGIYVIIKLHADSESQSSLDTLLGFLGRDQYCASKGDFLTALSDGFYSQAARSNPNAGIAHLTNLWLRISNVTRSNSLVVGFDLLNEPWTCSKSSLSKTQVHDYWHDQVSEITSRIRGNNDDRIIFAEEAPNYYGFQYFQPYSDSNIVNSIHWYRGAFKTTGGTFMPCATDYGTLYGYFSNVARRDNRACSSQEGDSIVQAQRSYPNKAFMVGEFGNIYGNKQGDNEQQWIQESIRVFKYQHLAGWIYWSSGDNGTWIADLQIGRRAGVNGLAGDLNHDGTVNITDVRILSKAWNSVPGNKNWNLEADLNNDGVVNMLDFQILLRNYTY